MRRDGTLPKITSRGVYELPYAPQGRRAFHLVASTGAVGYVDFPESWPELVRNLWQELDRVDPVSTLALVREL